MRTYNASFQAENQKLTKEPRHVLEIHGDTNTYYILSHSDIDIPGVSSDYIIQSSFIKSSVFSQTLTPIEATSKIGKMSFDVMDINSSITNMLTAIDGLGESLRKRKIVYKYGYKGLDYTNYINIQTQEINDKLSNHGTYYTINCRDVQRALIEKIFTPKTTTLMSSISKTAISIPAKLVTEFETITHTATFTDAPNETVGYFRIEDEVIRWTSKDAGTDTFTVDNVSTSLSTTTAANDTTVDIADITGFSTSGLGYIDDGSNISEIRWTGITANSPGPSGTLTGVSGIKYAHPAGASPICVVVYSKGRGVFNTVAVKHDVDSGITDDDRKPTITEWIYLEMNVIEMALTIMTRTIYGSSPLTTIPDHWGIGISTNWIATSTFDNIGTDLYDPTDNTSGLKGRLTGATTESAQSFLELEIYRLIGVFPLILGDGQIALKRLDETLPDSPYKRRLDDSRIVTINSFDLDYDDIYNEFEILWNWDAIKEEYTRRLILQDSASIAKHQKSKRLTLKFKLLHGSIHTTAIIKHLLEFWRSRHAGPPYKGSGQIFALNNDLEVGDIVLIDTDIYRDPLA